MVPDDVNFSAFAVYSGTAKKSISRNQKRRLKSREEKSSKSSGRLGRENEISMNKLKKKGNQDPSIEGLVTSNEFVLQKQSPSSTNVEHPEAKFIMKEKKKKILKVNKVSATNVPDAKEKPKHQLTPFINKRNIAAGVNGFSVFLESNEKEAKNNSSFSSDSEKKKKIKKIKRKISENVSEEKSEQNPPCPGKDSDLEPPKKIKKKVFISSPEPNARSEIKFKKPVVCTPRFPKEKKIIKNFGNKRQLLEISPSKTLQKVDQYLADKKEMELRLSKISNTVSFSKGQRSVKDIELAQIAKTEMQVKSSEVAGKYSFEKILEPVSVDTFMKENWEKSPLHIPSLNPKKFSKLISTNGIDAVLRDRVVNFGKHLDVTSYTNGQRETHNLEGRANAHVVWDFYYNGCSVRLLNPQYFFHSVHSLNAILQEYFGCFVGANSYLTPPNSQGFAPHYDDIEAFILQIEGSKIWRLYHPLDKNGYLPRFSSRNLLDEEIGEPILEVKLNPGDVLYFPRGYIHQGKTEEEHSLHLTLSVYQKTSWCDLLEKLLPLTLKNAASHDLEFRKGLPIGYLRSAGLVHKNAPSRKEIIRKVKKLINRLNDFLETDVAVDQMGLSFVQDALPPVLTVSEAACTIAGDGWKMRANGSLQNQVIITLNTRVRWTRAFCYRILEEDVLLEDGTFEKQIRIYHTLENSKEYHAEEPQYLIADCSMLPSLHHLTSVYPDFTKLSDLPSGDDDGKITFVSDLWDRGLLMTDAPLELFTRSKPEGEGEGVLTSEEMKIFSDLEEKVPKNDEKDPSSSGSDDEGEKSESEESVTNDSDMIALDEEDISEDDINETETTKEVISTP